MKVYVEVDIDGDGRVTSLRVTSHEPGGLLTGGREVYAAEVNGESKLTGASVRRGRVNGIIH